MKPSFIDGSASAGVTPGRVAKCKVAFAFRCSLDRRGERCLGRQHTSNRSLCLREAQYIL